MENALFPLDALPRGVNACVILFRYVGRTVLPAASFGGRIGLVHRGRCRQSLRSRSAPRCSWRASPPRRSGASSSRSALALGFLFFCVALLPASNLLFPIGTIFAERLAYLPSAGLCLAAGALLAGSAPEPGGAARPRRRGPGGGRPAPRRALDRAQFRLVDRRGLVPESRPDVARQREGPLRHRLCLGGRAAVFARPRASTRRRRRSTRTTGTPGRARGGWRRRWDSSPTPRSPASSAIESNPDLRERLLRPGARARGARRPGRRGGDLPEGARAEEGLAAAGVSAGDGALEAPVAGGPRGLAPGARPGPFDASVHADFASWLLRVGRTEDAAPEARRALLLDPRYLPPLRLLADRDARSRPHVRRGARPREDLPPLALAGRLGVAAARVGEERGVRAAFRATEEIARCARESKVQGPGSKVARTGRHFSGGSSGETLRRRSFSVVRRRAARIATRGWRRW